MDCALDLIGHLNDLVIIRLIGLIGMTTDHDKYVVVDVVEVIHIFDEVPTLVRSTDFKGDASLLVAELFVELWYLLLDLLRLSKSHA
jgi:hypothetical protein